MTVNLTYLETISTVLNEGTDKVTGALKSIEKQLNALALGIEAETMMGSRLLHSTVWEGVYLGYGRVDDRWGLFIRESSWNEEDDEERELLENPKRTPLLSASRNLRFRALNSIEDLIKELESEAHEFSEVVQIAESLADRLLPAAPADEEEAEQGSVRRYETVIDHGKVYAKPKKLADS